MFTRREILPLFAMPSLALLPSIDALAEAKVGKPKNSDKALIVIWLGGGPSQCETFDAKSDTIEASKPVTGCIQTKSNGMELGGSFNKLATIADRFSLIRGVSHGDANHDSATHYNMTGYMTPPGEQSPSKEPSIGAIISKTYGSNSSKNGIPHYVKANAIRHDGAAWMGIINDGFLANDDGIRNLGLNSTIDQFKRRMDFIGVIERSNQMEKNPLMGSWSDLRGQAGRVVTGAAAESFKIEKESDKTKELYGVGKSGLGRNLLLARRLIQNGTKVVTIHHGGWDNHSDIKNAMGSIAVELDTYLYSLLEDLKSLSLDKDVMVLVTGEFGRTRLNAQAGRDHNGQALSVLIAGGDFNHGTVVGQTLKDCMAPNARGIHPQDINATIFTHFGLPLDLTYIDNQKRPRRLIDGNRISLL